MTTGTLKSIAPDDLQETCPNCNGTGQQPGPESRTSGAGFGQKAIQVWPAPCGHRLCRGGKIPSKAGLEILKFVQTYPDVRVAF